MPRYWVIAPYGNDEGWERVWKFDLANNLISIGWRELGDVSSLDEKGLEAAIDRTYATDPSRDKRYIFKVFWNFYHSISPGDRIIARRGRKIIAAVGTVTRGAYYERDKNAVGQEFPYSNHIDVNWDLSPRGKQFPSLVFEMKTLTEITAEDFRTLVGAEPASPEAAEPENGVKDQTEFFLEKYLQEFIVENFDTIFRGKLKVYSNPQQEVDGLQFKTDAGVIDILAEEPATNSFVIIELKKGRESDKVIGQILRYMGWVAAKLCVKGQTVKGIIVCKEPDSKLLYALSMTKNITVKYYRIDFQLLDKPFNMGVVSA